MSYYFILKINRPDCDERMIRLSLYTIDFWMSFISTGNFCSSSLQLLHNVHLEAERFNIKDIVFFGSNEVHNLLVFGCH